MRTLSDAILASIEQSWRPFVLVSGLLLIGRVAASDGIFSSIGSRLARLRGNCLCMFASLMFLEATVTAILNLDTAVVFLTPVLIQAARQRGVREDAFVYGSIFIANAGSLVLPGSNLTNLLLIETDHLRTEAFATAMFLPWCAAVFVTIAVVATWRIKDLRQIGMRPTATTSMTWRLGALGIAGAIAFTLLLQSPAIAIFATGGVLMLIEVGFTKRIDLPTAIRSINSPLLVLLFLVAVGFGTLARLWSGPSDLMTSVGSWASAGVGAGSASVINNLPATVLLTAHPVNHPLALLIGLDLGPNLVVIGALSSLLWLGIARAEGAHPSKLEFTKIGMILVPLSICAALVALQQFSPGHF